jgi:FkbM family methyltransferase
VLASLRSAGSWDENASRSKVQMYGITFQGAERGRRVAQFNQPERRMGHHTNQTTSQVIARSFRFLGKEREYRQELGFGLGIRWYAARALARLPIPGPKRIEVKPRGLLHPLAVRMKGSSDEFVFDEIFVRHEYRPICEHLRHHQVILDLGANVGYASAFFASRFPDARIIAVEPDPANFELCRQNLEPYGKRIMILQGAVWSSCSKLALSHELGNGWATQVAAAENDTRSDVEGWDLPALLDMCRIETVDLLKIDIEGSEAEVFCANSARWLSRVRNICIELHDARCRETFFRALDGFDYELLEHRESTMCLNMEGRSIRRGCASGGARTSRTSSA